MVGYRQISVTCFKAHSRRTKQRSLLNRVNEVLLRITVLTLASVSSERRWSAHQAPVPFLPDVCKHTSIVSFILLMFIIDNGSDVQHGSPTTSHHCSMTFTGYQCHSCAHLALPAWYGSMYHICRQLCLRSLCSLHLQQSAIWRHHTTIADRLQTTAKDIALQPLVWSLTVWLLSNTVVGFICFCC